MTNDDVVFMQPYGETSPRDVNILELFDSTIQLVERSERTARLDICKQCPKLEHGTNCLECGCFMQMKTWTRDARCPIDKW